MMGRVRRLAGSKLRLVALDGDAFVVGAVEDRAALALDGKLIEGEGPGLQDCRRFGPLASEAASKAGRRRLRSRRV